LPTDLPASGKNKAVQAESITSWGKLSCFAVRRLCNGSTWSLSSSCTPI